MTHRKLSSALAVLLFFALLPGTSEAGRRPAWDRLPSHGGRQNSVERQYGIARAYRLGRIRDRAELRRWIADGRLVTLPDAPAYYLDPESVGAEDADNAELYRYGRPWVRDFLDEVLAEGFALHGERFKITSVVRSVEYQARLRRGNRAAAAAWASSHVTGSTVDISLEGLSDGAKRWLRERLWKLDRRRAVDAIEEPGCLHVMVFPDYVRKTHPAPAGRKRR